MAWIIQSLSAGPICIHDLNITLTKGAIRDVDINGREAAEKSMALKTLLESKPPFLKTIRKDPAPVLGNPSTEAIQKLEKQNEELKSDLAEQKEQTSQVLEVLSAQTKILKNLQEMAAADPAGARAIKAALEGIQKERGNVAIQKEQLVADEHLNEGEIKAHEKILSLKDKKLEKNYKELGKIVTKETDASVQDALDAMDELGI